MQMCYVHQKEVCQGYQNANKPTAEKKIFSATLRKSPARATSQWQVWFHLLEQLQVIPPRGQQPYLNYPIPDT